MNTTTRPRILTALAAGVFALGLASCAQQAPTGSSNYEAETAAWESAMQDCMREAGFEVTEGDESAAPVEDEAAAEAAWNACTEQVGDLPTDPDSDPAANAEAAQKMVECLRAEGLDVDDPVEGKPLVIPADAPKEVLDKCAESVNQEMDDEQPGSTEDGK